MRKLLLLCGLCLCGCAAYKQYYSEVGDCVRYSDSKLGCIIAAHDRELERQHATKFASSAQPSEYSPHDGAPAVASVPRAVSQPAPATGKAGGIPLGVQQCYAQAFHAQLTVQCAMMLAEYNQMKADMLSAAGLDARSATLAAEQYRQYGLSHMR